MGNQIPSPPPPAPNDDQQYEDRNDDVGRIQSRLAKKYNKMVSYLYFQHSIFA